MIWRENRLLSSNTRGGKEIAMKRNLIATTLLGSLIAFDAAALELVKRIVPIEQPYGSPVAIPAGRRVNAKGEHVVLRNGDVFRGKFLGFDLKHGLRWQHPDIASELNIQTDSIASLALENLKPKSRPAPSEVVLANGSRLSGRLLKLEDGKAVMDTWYAGELTIPLAAVKTLTPGISSDKMLFEGPVLGKNWTYTNGRWQFNNGAFTSNTSSAMVGRFIDETPARSSIDFEVDWQGSMNLYVNFHTDKLNNYSACNGYNLRIAQSYVYLYRYTLVNGAARATRLNPGRVTINLNTAKGNARFAVKVDERKNTIALYINDKFIARWTDPAGLPSESKGLLFTSRTATRMQLSNIRVSEWNGGLPGQSSALTGELKEDYVLLNNDNSLKCEILKMAGDKLQVRSQTIGEANIALDQVSMLQFATTRKLPAPANDAKAPRVKAELHGRNSLEFQLLAWQDGKLQIAHTTLGRATLDAAAIQSLTFLGDQPAGIGLKTVPNRRPGTGSIPLPIPQRAEPFDLEIREDIRLPEIRRRVPRR